jgi:hypothetical protein
MAYKAIIEPITKRLIINRYAILITPLHLVGGQTNPSGEQVNKHRNRPAQIPNREA